MKRLAIIALLVLAAALLVGCAPGANQLANTSNSVGVVAGFWRGLWNGIIAPVTFVISLFDKNVQMYEVHNNGGWYNFGFLLGVMIVFGGGGRGAAGRRGER